MYTQAKQPGVFRVASTGDIHFGHPRTPTSWIIRNLNKHLTNDTVMAELDMLVITGDLYDRLLTNNDPQTYEIQHWITQLLLRAVRHNVMVRIVEGTPSHDREQTRFMSEQAISAEIPVDLHYASTLSIEYIEKFGIHILYVPDKWRTDTSETYAEVLQLLKRHNIEQVDFAIMHGAFEYQLPAVVTEPSHDSDAYLRLVKYFIFIGHVHNATRKDRILAAGSFDRDGHGSEEAKGYYDVKIYGPDDYRVTFVENPDAKRYLTVDCIDMPMAEAMVAISKVVSPLNKGEAVKIRCRPGDPIAGDMKTIQDSYPHIEWMLDKEKSERTRREELDELMTMDIDVFTPIDARSVPTLLSEDIARLAIDANQQDRCVRRLTALLEG